MKNRIIKKLMKIMEVIPEFDLTNPRSESINHSLFLNSNEIEKEKILMKLAENHYKKFQKKPFSINYPNHDLLKIFRGKDVLDLGCWCGGMSVFCAEEWRVKSMSGLDIEDKFVNTAQKFADSRNNKSITYDFRKGFGEDLPFKDQSFDAIISNETFEHVVSVEKTLEESKRVLKPGGLVFCVFPSYYTPGEAHLGFVSSTPLLQWFFDSDSLNRAYIEILLSRGSEADWYIGKREKWQKLKGGIGINGTTFSDFRESINRVGFSKAAILPTPLFSIGASSMKNPRLKYLSSLIKPLVRTHLFQDLLSHRIVAILKV